MRDTITALATPKGRGAVAVVRLSGPAAFAIAGRVVAGKLPEPRRARLRSLRDAAGKLIDRGLVLVFPEPESYTGENVVEFQVHGGPVVAAWLLEATVRAGARLAEPGEYTERAFLNGRIDLAQAEGVADLIDAASRSAVTAAQRSLEGEFSSRVRLLVDGLGALRVYIEGSLDFSDEDIDWIAEGGLRQRARSLRTQIEQLERRAAQGRRLRDGLRVAIAGRPNVGKSTLLNRLAGVDAAIVSEIPGTTRDPLREHLVLDGLPVIITDTAGLRETHDPIEREGVARAHKAIGEAELVLYVVEDAKGLTSSDRKQIAKWEGGPPVVVVRNKCDLSARAAATTTQRGRVEVKLSAREDVGVDLLRAEIRRYAGLDDREDSLFLARARHLDALRQAREHVEAAAQQLGDLSTTELAAEELRSAQKALGRITGVVTADDLLAEIFASFCIGK